MDPISLVMLIGIPVIFYLLIIRPSMRRQKEMVSLQSSLTVGDDVVLTSGIFGTITAEHDDHVELEIAPGTVIRVARGALGAVRRNALDDEQSNEQDEQSHEQTGDESAPTSEER